MQALQVAFAVLDSGEIWGESFNFQVPTPEDHRISIWLPVDDNGVWHISFADPNRSGSRVVMTDPAPLISDPRPPKPLRQSVDDDFLVSYVGEWSFWSAVRDATIGEARKAATDRAADILLDNLSKPFVVAGSVAGSVWRSHRDYQNRRNTASTHRSITRWLDGVSFLGGDVVYTRVGDRIIFHAVVYDPPPNPNPYYNRITGSARSETFVKAYNLGNYNDGVAPVRPLTMAEFRAIIKNGVPPAGENNLGWEPLPPELVGGRTEAEQREIFNNFINPEGG